MTAPLDGVLIADFTRVLAGPLATMTLADLGARVIKVERPGSGDETRAWGPPYSAHGTAYYDCVNRGKESIALDLGDPGDLALARELAQRADVVVDNFKPGTMDRLGLGYDDLSRHDPRTICCSITGFGSGAGRDRVGYDFLVQALGGLMSVTGPADQPTKVGVAVVDVLTGKDAVIGILAALRARDLTGRGDRLEITLLTSLLGGLVNQAQSVLEGIAPAGLGNQHPSIAPYESLACGEGVLAVACGNDGQFARLVQVLGDPGLATDPRFATNPQRVAHRAEMRTALEALLAARPAADWVGPLTEAGVPAGTIGTIRDGLDLAGSLGLDPLVEVGEGHSPQVRHPIAWREHDLPAPTPPPALGEHDAALRAWLQRD